MSKGKSKEPVQKNEMRSFVPSRSTFLNTVAIIIALSTSFYTYTLGFHQVGRALNEMHGFVMNILPNKGVGVIPDETLRIFVLKTNETIPDNLMERVKKLKLNKFTMFSKAVCLSGEDTDVLKVSMDRSMNNVPKSVRETLCERALFKGITDYKDVEQNTGFDSRNVDNTGHVFLAFFHTKKLGDKNYRSCILVTGVDLKVAEQVETWEEKVEEKIVYVEKCQSGGLLKLETCHKVPMTVKQTTKFPIFKAGAISLEESEALFKYMQKNAVDNAKLLIAETKDLLTQNRENQETLGWSEGFPKPKIANS